MLLQLNPCMPVRTPKGPGLAHMLIDEGPEHDLMWVVFQDDTGECWTWKNQDIRAQKNITLKREYISPYYDPDDVKIRNLGCDPKDEDLEKEPYDYLERFEILSDDYSKLREEYFKIDEELKDSIMTVERLEFSIRTQREEIQRLNSMIAQVPCRTPVELRI